MLEATVQKLLLRPKGLLAIDESNDSCNKRFESVGIETTKEARRTYRELLVMAPEIESYVSGYIMYDETIRQATNDGERFPDILKGKGVEVGIKVDQSLDPFDDSSAEQVTKGLEGLADRLVEYRAMFGASFTKWRAVVHIGDGIPTDACLQENAQRLAQYARIVQDADMVPIIEPEVLLDGDHTMETCYTVTAHNLDIVFAEMERMGVYMPGLILKTSMVLPGKSSAEMASIDQVAQMTVKCLHEHVPNSIGGIVFLSGGQDALHATKHLNRMHQLYPALPWPLTFSYSRAIQGDTLEYWAQHRDDTVTAQNMLVSWAKADSQASVGAYQE